jgi:4-hydroxymandelate oxidase
MTGARLPTGSRISCAVGAFGQAGVERVLDILRAETRVAMQQLGTPSLKELTAAIVRKV